MNDVSVKVRLKVWLDRNLQLTGRITGVIELKDHESNSWVRLYQHWRT